MEKVCCGGGCCFLESLDQDSTNRLWKLVPVPDNAAFRSLQLKLGSLTLNTKLTKTTGLPERTVSFSPLAPNVQPRRSTVNREPAEFLKPHAPYDVFSANVHHARELTKSGAEKTTFPFDLDVTDYPAEGGDVDFVVGGAIGVCAPNSDELVTEVFSLLGVPTYIRDMPVMLHTKKGAGQPYGATRCRESLQQREESFSPGVLMCRVTLHRNHFCGFSQNTQKHRTRSRSCCTFLQHKGKQHFVTYGQDRISLSVSSSTLSHRHGRHSTTFFPC